MRFFCHLQLIAIDAALFEGRAPSFADENVTNNNSATIDNIGLTTGGTATNGTLATEAGTGTGKNGGTPRSTLISDLKLAGQCVTAGGAGNNTIPSGGQCTLTAKMGNKANVAIKGTQVQLSRTADGVWSCKIKPDASGTGAAGKGWKDKFIPSGCSKETTGGANNGWF